MKGLNTHAVTVNPKFVKKMTEYQNLRKMRGEQQTIPKKNNSYHGQTEGKEKTTTTKQAKNRKTNH